MSPTGLALLALYNLSYIAPLVALPAAVSNRRALGRLGRWNRANSPWVKVAIAVAVVAMSLCLLISLALPLSGLEQANDQCQGQERDGRHSNGLCPE